MTFDKWALRARTDERGQWLPIYDMRGYHAANYLEDARRKFEYDKSLSELKAQLAAAKTDEEIALINAQIAAAGADAKAASEKSGESLSHADVLRFALEEHLPLVVNVPTGTRQKVPIGYNLGTPTIEAGLWDLLIEGERGIPGRQQIEHDYHNQAQLPFIDITGIDGAWVKRDKVQCQLEPMRSSTGIYSTSPSALSSGCVLGVLRKALDDLAEKMPTPSAPDSADALDKPKPLGERERATLLSIIAALAEKAKIDLSQNSKAAAFIEAMTARIGLRVAVRTVENKLKDIKKLRDRSGKTSD